MNTVWNATIWAIISGGLGFYLFSIGWNILGWIVIIFCGMCVYTLFNIFSSM